MNFKANESFNENDIITGHVIHNNAQTVRMKSPNNPNFIMDLVTLNINYL
jgi:hypothetical protein